jgi:hypothetical protein
MARRNVEGVETRWGIIEQAATGFGKVALVAGHKRLPPVFGCRHRRRIAHIHPQRLELRPRLRRDFLLEILHFVKPAAEPEGLGPDYIKVIIYLTNQRPFAIFAL